MTPSTQKVITRFAPSPTGDLHLGGARTALFNWLFAKHYGGQFLLRIEDTDHQRSQEVHTCAILEGLSWLGLDWHGQPVIQSKRQERHVQVANLLLEKGKAYRCYDQSQKIHTLEMPEKRVNPWREASEKDWPAHVSFAIRLKMPLEGVCLLSDQVQGTIGMANETLDDLVLLRSDGTPTYMLAVVVDDHDMGITHIIRGSDHITNAFKQIHIYQAMAWDIPQMFHIPLIHDAQGHKLSKRHGALNLLHYKALGILPEALLNALLRLGWAHGNDEKITKDQAVEWFDGKGLSVSAARFDEEKVRALNRHYLRGKSAQDLMDLLELRDLRAQQDPLLMALAERCETLIELKEALASYTNPLTTYERPLTDSESSLLTQFVENLEGFGLDQASDEEVEKSLRAWVKERGVGFGLLAKGLRMALTGKSISPGLTVILRALGSLEVKNRILTALQTMKMSEMKT